MEKINMDGVIVERTLQGIRLLYWEDDYATRYSRSYVGYTLEEAKERFSEYLANTMVNDRAMQNISYEDLQTTDDVLRNALLCVRSDPGKAARYLLGITQ